MAQLQVILAFEGLNAADASQAAGDLADFLMGSCPGLQIETRRTDPDAMDMGATLVLVLGTPAIVAVASGIKAWLGNRDKAEITVKTATAEIVAKGLSSRVSKEIVIEALKRAEASDPNIRRS